MALLEYPGREARQTMAANPAAGWYLPSCDPDDPSGPFAVQRMKRPFFTPYSSAALRIDAGDRVFAIGSCFAREIEKAMRLRGFAVDSCTDAFDQCELYGNWGGPHHITNKYNTASILDSLRWALDPQAEFPLESLCEIEPGKWIDPHTAMCLMPADYEETLRRRQILDDLHARIRDCRLVVITLGLTEAWRDERTGFHLGREPHAGMLRREPDRYRFRVLDYEENLQNLEQTHALLRRHGHPDVQIVVTVSPIPLLATWTEHDVVTANTLSKATLRAVAGAFVASHDNVHYFPSYEIVLNSDRASVWAKDGRHVREECVAHIVECFARAHVDPPARSGAAWEERAGDTLRVLAWPRYDVPGDARDVLEQWSALAGKRDDVCLCLRFDPRVDGNADVVAQRLLAAIHALPPTKHPKRMVLIDDRVAQKNWSQLRAGLHYVLDHPSWHDELERRVLRRTLGLPAFSSWVRREEAATA